MQDIGRMLILVGVLAIAVGVGLVAGPRIPWLGRLPGDILIRKDNVTFCFPIGTSIVVSVVLTLLLNWFFRR
ncbi:MAG: DUF2905 domain-containing protein [Candidatus Binatia bacterium]